MTSARFDSERFLEEALMYVYIAQYVRYDGPDRAGVLAWDCQRYYSQITVLCDRGSVQKKTWGHLEGFVTTPKGTEAASNVVQQTLKANTVGLQAEFDKMPPRLLRYLFDEVFGSEPGLGRAVSLARDIDAWDRIPPMSPNPTYHCLLADREVAANKDHLVHTLANVGLSVVATNYVGTRGGEVRDRQYVLAAELETVVRDYLESRGLGGRLWPSEFEEMHVVLHQLDAGGNNFLRGWEEVERSIPVFYRESANSFLQECLKRKVIVEGTLSNGEPCFNLVDRLWYDTIRVERFKKPLLSFLLELGSGPPPPPPPPSLVVALTIAPSSVRVGEEVSATAKVTAGNQPATGASVTINWVDAQDKTTTDDRGICSLSHRYLAVGSYQVIATAVKTGAGTGMARAQVEVSVAEPQEAIRVGNLSDKNQHGILGRVDSRDVFLDLYEPHAITVLGVQGSGKSYAAGAIIEMAVQAIPGMSALTCPLSCIVFHFSKEEQRVPEWIGLASPNTDPLQTAKLRTEYGVSPSYIPNERINVLVPPTKLADRRRQYQGFNVMPLVFSPSKLKADDWQRLLTFGKGSDALYMEALKELMIELRDKNPNFDTKALKAEIHESDLSQSQKRFALQRIRTIGRWLSEDGHPFVELLKPGFVNLVDLRDPLAVDANMASLILQTVFSFVKDRPLEGICLVAIDEAHLFFEHEHLTKEIVEFVALLRKDYKVYLLLMSQQPGRFAPDILALSDVIICYRLESDSELDFLKKHKPGFAGVTKDIKNLKTGEGKALMWARVSTNNLLDTPRLIAVRPKVTADRGKTATAF